VREAWLKAVEGSYSFRAAAAAGGVVDDVLVHFYWFFVVSISVCWLKCALWNQRQLSKQWKLLQKSNLDESAV
jgi:hypothetical protein